MIESWNEILQNEPVGLTPRPGFKVQLREGLVGEWDGRPMITPTASNSTPARERSTRRGWLLGAAAVSVLLIGGVIVAVSRNTDPTLQTPTTDPLLTTTPTLLTLSVAAESTVSATTEVASQSTAVENTIGPTTAAPDTTLTPGTIASAPNLLAITVPLSATTALPLRPIATVEYGPGDEQIEVLNGEFPPPAVLYVGGVLVLEDAPESGLTGDGVIVQTGPDAVFEDGTERRFLPMTIDVAEPGGTPIAVRSLDGGGIVVVTVHDDQRRVRIRQYSQNPPGLFTEFGKGTDIEALGDSQLRITSDGATWGGGVVVPLSDSNPDAVRPIVTSDPEFGFSSSYEIERPAQDGEQATSWTLDVEFDQEFPPVPGSPLVEPFGDGALVARATPQRRQDARTSTSRRDRRRPRSPNASGLHSLVATIARRSC